MIHDADEQGRCLNLGCLHNLEIACNRRCETEEQVADQIAWLRRLKWKHKHPWMAKVIT